ncbi:MAG: protein TolA [Crocinitomicaceae bacterium]|nr:protein TolA [Crocinitomicaceae bacterium]
MRATRTVRRPKTDNTLKFKSVGLSILLHIVLVGVVFGVGFKEHKSQEKPEQSAMKAVLWIPTSTPKATIQEPVEVPNKPELIKGVGDVSSPELLPTSDSDEKVNLDVQNDEKSPPSDPWLDELSSLEPLEQSDMQENDSEIVSDSEPKEVDVPGIEDSIVSQPSNEFAQVKSDETKNTAELSKDEAYVDAVFTYRLDVARHIQSKWKVDSKFSGLECDIDISIMRDGTILMLNSLMGNDDVCESAKMAIKRIRKLPAAPTDSVFNQLKRMSVKLTVQ